MKKEIINENIHINQIGYRLKDKKIAIINGRRSKLAFKNKICNKFDIINDENNEILYSGDLTGGSLDESSGDIVYYADFTCIERSGAYHISVQGLGRSFSFRIEEHVYKDVKNALIKGLYYQRCGVQLEEEHAGPWKHKACHLQTGRLFEDNSKTLDGTGGWHDAGDYGKYTIAGAYAAAFLLIAYELMPTSFGEAINIPESGNGIPDILNETRFELEWLLKMQDKASGGVYSKFTSKVFPDNLARDSKGVMPEDDTHDLFFFPITSTATADFAAVMGLASRVYKQFDQSFAAECLEAAEKAWDWLDINKELICPRNPPGVVTGEYWDDSDRDDRYWAAAELFRTTYKKEYHDYVIKVFKSDEIENGMWWRSVGGLGNIAYLFADREKVDQKTYNEIKDSLLGHADILLNNSKEDGYRLSFKNHYIWGSNLLVMNSAFYMIIANFIRPDNAYIEAAQYHMDYLLGRNAVNYCYVTGFGSKPVMYPHHRPSSADGVEEPVPGLVSGGPNKELQDRYAQKRLTGKPPARCFIDSDLSYATNEVAIYWNTPAVFVAAYFDME